MTEPQFTCVPQALLFDCDGVLVDSDESVLTAWTRWAEQFGLDPLAVFATVHGRRSAETVAALVAAPLRPAALAAIDGLELEEAHTVTPIPGAADLLARLPDRRWALVTSATRALAEARLTAAGLPRPAVLVTAEDVQTGKPDPAGYLLAARQLGVAARSCVVLEDAVAGVAAARAAAAGWVIGLGPRVQRADVDAVVPDMRSVAWDDATGVFTASL